MEARGKFDFTATGPDELSFRKGDVLKILSPQDDWYEAEMNGQKGFIPQNYIEMQTPSWFQENSSRHAAEEVLRQKSLGDFMIRGCQSSPGDFSISVKHESDVQHFKVMKDNKGQYFLWLEKFTSLNQLVQFYKSTSISKTREIYLNDGSPDCKNPAVAPSVKRGSLPEQRNPSAAVITAGRRASDQPPNQLAKKVGLEERAHTIGHTGRSSPVPAAHPSQRSSDTMPLPQVKRGSLPEQRNPSAAVITAGRRASDQPPNQLRAPAQQVKALYDFHAEEDDELGFSAGDIIELSDRSDASWWRGRLRGKSGLFPADYTMRL